jgi:hypothetical protein
VPVVEVDVLLFGCGRQLAHPNSVDYIIVSTRTHFGIVDEVNRTRSYGIGSKPCALA